MPSRRSGSGPGLRRPICAASTGSAKQASYCAPKNDLPRHATRRERTFFAIAALSSSVSGGRRLWTACPSTHWSNHQDGQRGVPQGEVISPLLSNLYLTEVDGMLERAKETTRFGKYTYIEYARFADDLVSRLHGCARQVRRTTARSARSSKLRAFCCCAIAMAVRSASSVGAISCRLRLSRISPRMRCKRASVQCSPVSPTSVSASSIRAKAL